MKKWTRFGLVKIFSILVFMLFIQNGIAQNTLELTLNQAVEIAMKNSYRIKQLKLGIERTRQWLKAERAGLKTKIYMNLKAPEIQVMSEYKWNSDLHRDEVVKRNTRLWQMDFSIRQPVILFGYPTNGYLSPNNKIYRYMQKNENNDITYYNRYFIKFEQPFFQPNRLKNDIERAELDLEENELEYLTNIVDIIEWTADDYYDVFRFSYLNIIYSNHVANLERVEKIVETIVKNDTSRSIEKNQVEVELANAREILLQNMSNLRLEVARMKQRLGLNSSDTLSVSTEINIKPVYVDLERALEYGYNLRPQLRLLANRRRQNEITLENVKGSNAFRVDLEVTYGIEKQDDDYRYLWEESDNSYSITLNAYIPLWDWGQRKARIEAQKITLKKTDLWIEETKRNIESEITNAVENLEEFQQRTINMKRNMEMAKEITLKSINQYRDGKISLQDLLQTINRQKETEINFLNVYIDYRRSLLNLMIDTYYDFENDVKLFDQFRVTS